MKHPKRINPQRKYRPRPLNWKDYIVDDMIKYYKENQWGELELQSTVYEKDIEIKLKGD
jgi:hypothetical protein